jgi:hypothetical protein
MITPCFYLLIIAFFIAGIHISTMQQNKVMVSGELKNLINGKIKENTVFTGILLVEPIGIEPTTSYMPCKRSPS